MCSLESVGIFLKDWGVAGVLFAALIAYWNEQSNRKKKYISVMSLLWDETANTNVEPVNFDPEKTHYWDPVVYYSVELLLTEYFGEVRKNKKLMDLIWNLNVSVQKLNNFSKDYNRSILRERKDVDFKRKMLENMEGKYLINVREDVKKLRDFLPSVLKELGVGISNA